MRAMLLCLLFACAGCDRLAVRPVESALAQAQRDSLLQPIGRFQLAGKREFPNGSEIYVLDTKTGQVCYYFVASGTGGEKDQKTDMRGCAGDPLTL